MDRRTLLKAGMATAAGGLLPASGALTTAASAAPRVTKTLATGVTYPWGIDFLPRGGALVTERNSGRILRVRAGGGYSVVGTVPGVVNYQGGEGGLLGLALSPNFAEDRWVYCFLTTQNDNRIVRMRYDEAGLGPVQVLLSGIPRAKNHNGGGLWFSSDQSLLASTGDATDRELAQNKSSLAGKILRLTPDGAAHPGNPFSNEVYSFGHRNPEGVTTDPSGKIWSSEFGENTWDELNRIVAGGNYGWPRAEGADGAGGFRDPLAQWHPENCSPSGIAILGGRAWLGALRGECLWSVDIEGGNRGVRRRYFKGTYGRIRLVKRAPDGALWIGTSNNNPRKDRILRVVI